MADDVSCVKEIRREGATIVVTLAGEIDLHHAPEVHKQLVAVCQRKPARVVINLEEVGHMDSSGIGTLVELFRRVNAYQGELILCGLNERVQSVFEITKLDHFFSIYDTEAEALTA